MSNTEKEISAFDQMFFDMLSKIDFDFMCFNCGTPDKSDIETIGLLDTKKGWRLRCVCKSKFDIYTKDDVYYDLILLISGSSSLHYISKKKETFLLPENAKSNSDLISMPGLICKNQFDRIINFI